MIGGVNVTTKERIQARLEHVREEHLEELDDLIASFLESRQASAGQPGLLSRLQRISIDAPEDFSENLEQYASGEKTFEPKSSSH